MICSNLCFGKIIHGLYVHYRSIDGYADGRMDDSVGRWIDRWGGGRMDGWVNQWNEYGGKMEEKEALQQGYKH